MCGISIVIHLRNENCCQCLLKLQSSETQRLNLIRNRGPDSFKSEKLAIGYFDIIIHSSVLHIRGSDIIAQPVSETNAYQNLLLWNGEVFNGIHVKKNESDTLVLHSLLCSCETDIDYLNIFSSVEGPWAFAFIHLERKQLWFGRDIFGRRSLLWNYTIDPISKCEILKISSVSGNESGWNTIPSIGIFCLHLDKSFDVKYFPWSHSVSGSDGNVEITSLPLIISKGSTSIKCPIAIPLNETEPFEFQLTEFVDQRSCGKNYSNLFQSLLEHQTYRNIVDNFLEILGDSVNTRVNNQNLICKKCTIDSVCEHPTVAVMFSGGLDCTILALLASKFLPINLAIDLLNVSFEHKVTSPTQKKKKLNSIMFTYNSPDRISAKESYEELKRLCPDRKWNLVEIDVTKSELKQCRETCIQPLIFPLSSVLDDSIGCATWFAARGTGKVKSEQADYAKFHSTAKILLLGMGADEQLGGYSRHRNQFSKDGWKGLIKEIRLEIDRISERNLSRDDRIISDHGKEARYPYLDENVVAFLNNLPIWFKANLSIPRGFGEKILLRTVAFKLGLKFSSSLPKRAIQFGSRIAHLEEKREKGADVCERLKYSCRTTEGNE